MTDEVRASHILLMYEGSMRSTADRSKADAESQIQALKAELESGADFAALARAHSDCPSGQQAGDLASFRRGMMVPEFDEATFGLAVCTESDVVESAFAHPPIPPTAHRI